MTAEQALTREIAALEKQLQQKHCQLKKELAAVEQRRKKKEEK